MKRFGLALAAMSICSIVCADETTGSTIVDNELLINVAEGETLTYNTQLAATLTKVIKTGAGRAIVTNDANATFTGVTEIREGVLEIQSNKVGIIPTLGDKKANSITVTSGAQLFVRAPTGPGQGSKHFNNQFYIAGYGPDGTGAVRYQKAWEDGSGHFDQLMGDVTLTGDTLISSTGARFGIGSGTVDMGGYKLDMYPKGASQFMLNGGTWTNGHMRFSGNMNPIFQNVNKLPGGPENTMTLDGTVTLGFWSTPLTFDWSLIAHNGTYISIGSGGSHNNNNIAGPITLADGTVRFSTYMSEQNMRQHLKGKISGAGKLRKQSHHFLYLDNEDNDWSGGTEVAGEMRGGLIAKYPGSVPRSGPVTLTTGMLGYDPEKWNETDVKTLAEYATYGSEGVNGGFIAPYFETAEGTETLNCSFDKGVQIGIGYKGTLNYTGRLADGSVLRNLGGNLNVPGDNDGVALSAFQLASGTTTFSGMGYVDTAANDCRIGGTNSVAQCRVIVKDGTTFARSVPADGAGTVTKVLFINDEGTKGAVLEVREGGAVTNKFNVGSADRTSGAVYVDGGSAFTVSGPSNDGNIGSGFNGYGFIGVYAGEFGMRGWCGFGPGRDGYGVIEQKGGKVYLSAQGFCLSRGGTARARFSGGTFSAPNDYIRMGEQEWGDKSATKKTAVLTIDGNADVSAEYVAITMRTNAFTSVLNLNGGVFKGNGIRKGNWETSKRDALVKGYVNFNGGTFKGTASASAGSYYSIFGWGELTAADAKCDAVHIFEKGAVIDTNGRDLGNGNVPLLAPTGKGVKAIRFPAGTVLTGQLGSPVIEITGDGIGATAWCEFDHKTGTVGDIVVTSPGWGYTTVTVTAFFGDRRAKVTCEAELGTVASGGLTVKGGGRFQIYGTSNTYAGETYVTNATIVLGAENAIPAESAMRLANGTFDLANKTQTVKSIGGFGSVKNGTLTISDALVFDAATAQDKTTSINFTSPVVMPAEMTIANSEALDENKADGVLCTFATPITREQVPLVHGLKPGWRAYLSNGGKTLKFGYLKATTLILR